VLENIQRIYEEGRPRLNATSTNAPQSQFAVPFSRQVWELCKRNHRSYYRDPTYITSKLLLSLFTAIFVGLPFFRSKDDQLGAQSKLFVSSSRYYLRFSIADLYSTKAIYMATVISYVPVHTIALLRLQPSTTLLEFLSWTSLSWSPSTCEASTSYVSGRVGHTVGPHS